MRHGSLHFSRFLKNISTRATCCFLWRKLRFFCRLKREKERERERKKKREKERERDVSISIFIGFLNYMWQIFIFTFGFFDNNNTPVREKEKIQKKSKINQKKNLPCLLESKIIPPLWGKKLEHGKTWLIVYTLAYTHKTYTIRSTICLLEASEHVKLSESIYFSIILTSNGRPQRNHIADLNMYRFMRVVYAKVYDVVHVISISSSYSPGWGCSLWVFRPIF